MTPAIFQKKNEKTKKKSIKRPVSFCKKEFVQYSSRKSGLKVLRLLIPIALPEAARSICQRCVFLSFFTSLFPLVRKSFLSCCFLCKEKLFPKLLFKFRRFLSIFCHFHFYFNSFFYFQLLFLNLNKCFLRNKFSLCTRKKKFLSICLKFYVIF